MNRKVSYRILSAALRRLWRRDNAQVEAAQFAGQYTGQDKANKVLFPILGKHDTRLTLTIGMNRAHLRKDSGTAGLDGLEFGPNIVQEFLL